MNYKKAVHEGFFSKRYTLYFGLIKKCSIQVIYA